jgi:AraC-like DNA-binding protein
MAPTVRGMVRAHASFRKPPCPLAAHAQFPVVRHARPMIGAMDRTDLVLLRRARDQMDREFARPLDVEALARTACMSSGHFSRSFRAAYGESPYSYLMTRRIERAMTLLRRGDLSVTEVCFEVGCSSLGTFSTRFTELVGESPSAYKARDHAWSEPLPACLIKAALRPVRNREAPEPERD